MIRLRYTGEVTYNGRFTFQPGEERDVPEDFARHVLSGFPFELVAGASVVEETANTSGPDSESPRAKAQDAPTASKPHKGAKK